MQAENQINQFDKKVMQAERQAGFPVATSTTKDPDEKEDLKWEDREMNALWSLVALGVVLALCSLCYSLHIQNKTAQLEAQLYAERGRMPQEQLPLQQEAQQPHDEHYGEYYQEASYEQTEDQAHGTS